MLVRDHTSKVFQPKYKDFCITGFLGKNQIEVKDNHGHTTKVHRRDVKKIPMTDKICQMYEEEQVNKIRNGRRLVPDNKMPDLSWNLEKQETSQKGDIQEIEESNSQNRTLRRFIHMIILVYSYTLLMQDIVCQYTEIAAEAVKQAIRTTKNFSRTSWTKLQEEMKARLRHLSTCRENRRNQSYRSYDYNSGYTTTPINQFFQVGGPDLFCKDRDPHGNCRLNKRQSHEKLEHQEIQ